MFILVSTLCNLAPPFANQNQWSGNLEKFATLMQCCQTASFNLDWTNIYLRWYPWPAKGFDSLGKRHEVLSGQMAETNTEQVLRDDFCGEFQFVSLIHCNTSSRLQFWCRFRYWTFLTVPVWHWLKHQNWDFWNHLLGNCRNWMVWMFCWKAMKILEWFWNFVGNDLPR